ncbi:MAG: hypothetical protein ACOC98_16660 [Thermodesulfobacteriota bacterium]
MTRWIRGAVRVATMATILTAMAAGPAVAGPFNSAPGARARAWMFCRAMSSRCQSRERPSMSSTRLR